MEKLKYPIGHFECPNQITETHINEWIVTLEELPSRLEQLVKGLNDEQLNTPYRLRRMDDKTSGTSHFR